MGQQIGATGEFPDGQLNETDEGELTMAIGIENDAVVLQFGKPVAWLGLPPDNARELAKLLNARADEIDGGQK